MVSFGPTCVPLLSSFVTDASFLSSPAPLLAAASSVFVFFFGLNDLSSLRPSPSSSESEYSLSGAILLSEARIDILSSGLALSSSSLSSATPSSGIAANENITIYVECAYSQSLNLLQEICLTINILNSYITNITYIALLYYE